MHELGVVMEVVCRVEKIAVENELKRIETLVLQIGELSSIIPAYVKACYPAAVDGTILEKTKLQVEILPGIGQCRCCGEEYNLIDHRNICPVCGDKGFNLISGKEFLIKEIFAY